MNQSSNSDLLSKLYFQISSFQDGFRLLNEAKSIEDIAKNFNHILRGTLLITKANILFKPNNEKVWREEFSTTEDCKKYISYLKDENIFEEYKDSEIKYAIVHSMIDGSKFGLLIGDKLDHSEYTEEDKIILQMFLQLLDNAYQSYKSNLKEKQLNFSLNHRLLQLNTLIDTGIEISKLQNKNKLLETALERAVSLTNASKGIIKIIRRNKVIGVIKLPVSIDIEDFSKSQNKIITAVEYAGLRYEVELVDKESRLGIVPFDETDRILLEAFARQVHAAVENEQLHKDALENETIKKELSVASSIQKKIIPNVLPQIDGYDLAGTNIPSKEVGGDYYDCFKMSDGRYALVMADVAGKGVPASLLVSTLNASLKAYLDVNYPLSDLAVKLNKVIYNASPPDKFITFFISILDPETGELDIINAGHNPALLLRKDGNLEKIEAGGVAFGMFDMGLPFEGQKLLLEKGERLLLFTDGIPEAMNIDEDEYSDEILDEFFKSHVPESAETFISDLIADVRQFTQNTPQSDDITALYIIRK